MAGEPSGWAVEEYVTAGGKNLVFEFLKGLIGEPKAETIALIKLVKERGNLLRMPHSKPLGEGLFELRGKQVRIFYMFRPGRRITLLEGMVKKQDQIPHRVLARMKQLKKEVETMDAEAARGP
jgi:hypothetical protein